MMESERVRKREKKALTLHYHWQNVMPKGDKNEKKDNLSHYTSVFSVCVPALSLVFRWVVERQTFLRRSTWISECSSNGPMAMVLVCAYRALVCMVAIVSVWSWLRQLLSLLRSMCRARNTGKGNIWWIRGWNRRHIKTHTHTHTLNDRIHTTVFVSFAPLCSSYVLLLCDDRINTILLLTVCDLHIVQWCEHKHYSVLLNKRDKNPSKSKE